MYIAIPCRNILSESGYPTSSKPLTVLPSFGEQGFPEASLVLGNSVAHDTAWLSVGQLAEVNWVLQDKGLDFQQVDLQVSERLGLADMM